MLTRDVNSPHQGQVLLSSGPSAYYNQKDIKDLKGLSSISVLDIYSRSELMYVLVIRVTTDTALSRLESKLSKVPWILGRRYKTTSARVLWHDLYESGATRTATSLDAVRALHRPGLTLVRGNRGAVEE